jgi:hypothetical protein
MFSLLIEVNVAIAGFAGIISAFRFRDREDIQRGPVAALTVVVQVALVVALVACLPLLLSTFGFSGDNIWFISSIVAVPLGSVMMYSNYLNVRPALQAGRGRMVHAIVQLVGTVAVVANVLNAANLIFHREPGPVLFAGVVMSTIAGWMFVRLILNPLWKTVRDKEVENSIGD